MPSTHPPAWIRLNGIGKRFQGPWGEVRALRQISLEIPPAELVTLLGPSGCGKTTLLRCIAGLEHPEEGEIVIGDRVVFSASRGIHLPAHRRRVGMVFQNYAVWPHMTVAQNVAFPLEAAGTDRRTIGRRVADALRLVGLLEHADRPAPQLSGGQQQRVALARALVGEPSVLLLDEPLSNLDAKLRESMRLEIRELQRRVGITTVYVTHDQAEALSISDRVAVVSDGRIVEVGTPLALYTAPRALFTAEFVGAANVFPIESLVPRGNGSMTARCRLGAVVVHGPRPDAGSGSLYLVIRPEDILLSADRPAHEANVWQGQVMNVTFEGSRVLCRLRVDGALVSAVAPGRMPVAPGDTVTVAVASGRCVIVSAIQ